MGWKLEKNGEVTETLSEDTRDMLLSRGWELVSGSKPTEEPPSDMSDLLDDLDDEPKGKKAK